MVVFTDVVVVVVQRIDVIQFARRVVRPEVVTDTSGTLNTPDKTSAVWHGGLDHFRRRVGSTSCLFEVWTRRLDEGRVHLERLN